MADIMAQIQRHITEEELLEAQSLSKKPNNSSRREKGRSSDRTTATKREPGGQCSDSKIDWPPRYGKYMPTCILVHQILARIDETPDDSLL